MFELYPLLAGLDAGRLVNGVSTFWGYLRPAA